MTFSFACPACDKTLRATEKHIGRVSKCPGCGASVTIPDPAGDAPEEDQPDEPVASPQPIAPPPAPPTPRTAFTERIKAATARFKTVKLSAPIATGIGFTALTVGYFCGREHVKYEIRSAFVQAGKELQKGLQEAFSDPESPKKASASKTKAADAPVEPIIPVGIIHNEGPLSIALVEARIGHGEVKSGIRDNTYPTDEKYLLCTFRVKNTDERKILTFHDSSGFGNNFVLHDDVNNLIRGVSFGFSSDLVGALKSGHDIQPGSEVTHIEVFTIPPPKTKHLILSAGLKAFSTDGRVKFKIDTKEIKGFSDAAQ